MDTDGLLQIFSTGKLQNNDNSYDNNNYKNK